MTRSQFVVLTLMLMLAVVAGAFVASIVPPLVNAQAQELQLAPTPPSSAAVVVPSFAELVERAVPSVVHVTSQRTLEERESGSFDMFNNPFFRRFMREPFGDNEEEREAPPQRPQYSAGSGFFFTTDGYILTNKHVVDGADRLIVRLDDDETLDAELVGIDPYLDLAVIKVNENRKFPALPLGDADELRVGEWVLAIGNPVDVGKSVTVGIVSGKGRQLNRGASSLDSYIQTDAAINFGNSGGPLLNTRGEVVGINTAILRDNRQNPYQSGLVEGIGFALPISQVNGVLDQLVNTGTVKRGYLGVTIRPVNQVTAEWYELEEPRGAVVQNVTPDLPAARAGVQAGDVILEVDGERVDDSRDLVRAISKHSPGDVVWLKILRRDPGAETVDQRELKVQLGERRVGLAEAEVPAPPQSPAEPETASALGLTVGEMDAQMREALADPDMRGVVITKTEPNSPAGDLGLVPGLIVLDVNGRPTPNITAYRDVVENLESGDPVRIRVAQPNGTQRLEFFHVP